MRTLKTKSIKISVLKPHPQNYKTHPEDQLVHLRESIRQFGFCRNIIIANDNTILVGHGIVQAAKDIGLEELPCAVMEFDSRSPKALKLLVAENEVCKLAETDDRILTDLLSSLSGDESISGLLGTGYSDELLSALMLATRSRDEIDAIKNSSPDWSATGMPAYESKNENHFVLSIRFPSMEDRMEFASRNNLPIKNSDTPVINVNSEDKGRADWRNVLLVDNGSAE